MVFIIVFLITGVLSNNNFLPNELTSKGNLHIPLMLKIFISI